ncbi:unnamed protein product, partial [Hapterophycus canaliculatus]
MRNFIRQRLIASSCSVRALAWEQELKPLTTKQEWSRGSRQGQEASYLRAAGGPTLAHPSSCLPIGAIPCIRDVFCWHARWRALNKGCFNCPAPLPDGPSSLVARTLAAFPLSTGGEANVPWAFVREARRQPDYPAYACPAVIVHGLLDDVVPVAATRSLVEGSGDLARHTFATFVEDDHALTQPPTMALIAKALVEFFDVGKKEGIESAGGAAAVEEAVEKSHRSARQENIEVKTK